jgi:hypothetical protein
LVNSRWPTPAAVHVQFAGLPPRPVVEVVEGVLEYVHLQQVVVGRLQPSRTAVRKLSSRSVQQLPKSCTRWARAG